MPSFQTSLSPHKRAAARFVVGVRRDLLKALASAHKRSGVTQSSIAQTLGVHRSVINREMRGVSNMTLSRTAELASAMGFEPHFELRLPAARDGDNKKLDRPIDNMAAPPSRSEDINAQLKLVAA